MKNILNESAKDKLRGRTKFTMEYVQDEDITEKDIQAAKDSIDDGKITLEVGSALELLFEDAFFDLVVSWDDIEHIPKNTEKQMIKRLKEFLLLAGSSIFLHHISVL